MGLGRGCRCLRRSSYAVECSRCFSCFAGASSISRLCGTNLVGIKCTLRVARKPEPQAVDVEYEPEARTKSAARYLLAVRASKAGPGPSRSQHARLTSGRQRHRRGTATILQRTSKASRFRQASFGRNVGNRGGRFGGPRLPSLPSFSAGPNQCREATRSVHACAPSSLPHQSHSLGVHTSECCILRERPPRPFYQHSLVGGGSQKSSIIPCCACVFPLFPHTPAAAAACRRRTILFLPLFFTTPFLCVLGPLVVF